MRKYTIPQSMTVEYFLGDHLGSTSITTDSTGAKVSELRYTPWGETRYTWTNAPATTPAYELTKYQYTGQYSYDAEFGLMFYNARWYDPYLNHFTQPDSIVPDPYNTQDWDRYSYARNNPLKYTDPTGHSVDCGIGDQYCTAGEYTPGALILLNQEHPCTELPLVCNKKTGLSDEIDTYLRNHPDYQVKEDKWLWRFSPENNPSKYYAQYFSIRLSYWENRTGGDRSEAYKLYQYYDLGVQGQISHFEFDGELVSWPNVALDAAGIPLSIFGGNVTKFGEPGGQILQATGIVDSSVSLIDATDKNDGVGVTLAVLSALPGIGPYASGVSLIRDLMQGVYPVYWFPSIPR